MAPNFGVPDWVPDAIFYQIFPDRFARSGQVSGLAQDRLEPWDSPPTRDGFKGGDLWGIVDKMDYLQDLGVNALYLCPIFQSTANHRYHTHDYYRIDPMLGGHAAFRALLDAAHARDMHVVLDGVFNHASRGFFQFNHILENGPTSPYADWFIIKSYPLNAYSRKKPPNYACWWDQRALPKFNVKNPAVRAFIFDVVRHWLAFGIDGWRIDVPEEIEDKEFWQAFRRVAKEVNPQAYLVGEIWGKGKSWLKGDRFDGIMNYAWARRVLRFTLGHKVRKKLRPGGYKIKPIDARKFAAKIEGLLAIYPPEITGAQLNLLGSHDTARYLTLAEGETDRLKIATLLQMTYPGAPCIYYGDEIGMQGGAEPDCRGAFPWNESQWDHDLLAYMRRLIVLRHALAPLRRGDLVTLYASKKQNVYACARRYQGETVVTVVNAGKDAFTQALPVQETGWSEGTRLVERLSEENAEVKAGQIVGLNLAPLSGAILTPESV